MNFVTLVSAKCPTVNNVLGMICTKLVPTLYLKVKFLVFYQPFVLQWMLEYIDASFISSFGYMYMIGGKFTMYCKCIIVCTILIAENDFSSS